MLKHELSPKAQVKRARVLHEATRLFSLKGFDSTPISHIADAAGISFGSVFTYFETKESLFRACVLEPLPRVTAEFTFDGDRGRNLTVEDLADTVSRHLKFFAQERLYLQLVQQVLGNPDRFPELFVELDHAGESMRTAIGDWVRQGQEQGLLEEANQRAVAVAYSSLLLGMRIFMTDPPQSSIWAEMRPLALKLLGLRDRYE